MNTDKTLHVLIIEDSDDDAQLVIRHIQKAQLLEESLAKEVSGTTRVQLR